MCKDTRGAIFGRIEPLWSYERLVEGIEVCDVRAIVKDFGRWAYLNGPDVEFADSLLFLIILSSKLKSSWLMHLTSLIRSDTFLPLLILN